MNTLPHDEPRCTGANPAKQYTCPDAVICSRCNAHRYWDVQCGVTEQQITLINAEPECEHRSEIEE